MEGGSAKTVVSSVTRRISHFFRWSARASCTSAGGFRSWNADSMRECVWLISRWRKALAARLYNERRVAAVDEADEVPLRGTDLVELLRVVCDG